jgi:hypothetical protein
MIRNQSQTSSHTDDRSCFGQASSKHPAIGPAWDETVKNLIARRAHDLYLARGKQKGYELQDWLQAEKRIDQSHDTA